jgi:FKBP-type peptidyl-prolyl cis-trans isomerase SlyD
MYIKKPCVVSLTWTLKDTLDEILDTLDQAVEFLVGGNDLFEKIEGALEGHGVGAIIHVHLEPEEAFGDFNENLIFLESRKLFPPDIEEGMTLEGISLPEGCHPEAPKDVIYTITEMYPDHIILDGNHPLSGIALRLSLKVEAVRAATEQETNRSSAGTGFFKVQSLPS